MPWAVGAPPRRDARVVPWCHRAGTAQSAAATVLACALSSRTVPGMPSEKCQRNVTTVSRLSQVADVVFRHVYSMAAQGRQAANMAPPGGRYVVQSTPRHPRRCRRTRPVSCSRSSPCGDGRPGSRVCPRSRHQARRRGPAAASRWCVGLLGDGPWGAGSPGRSRLATSTLIPPAHSRPGDAWPRRGHDRRLRWQLGWRPTGADGSFPLGTSREGS